MTDGICGEEMQSIMGWWNRNNRNQEIGKFRTEFSRCFGFLEFSIGYLFSRSGYFDRAVYIAPSGFRSLLKSVIAFTINSSVSKEIDPIAF